jgi:hypothetical protein
MSKTVASMPLARIAEERSLIGSAGPRKDLVRVIGEIISQPKDRGFGLRYHRPGRAKIRLNEQLQGLGPGAEHLLDGIIHRAFEISVGFRGDQVCMGAQDAVEHSNLKFLAENIDLVRAQEAEAIRFQQFVPEILQAHGGRRVTGVPKQIHHFAISAQTRIARLGAKLSDENSYSSLESLRVRLPVGHESGERLSGIQEQQTAFLNGCSGLKSLLFELLRKGIPMARRGDGNQYFISAQPFSEVIAYVFCKHALVVIELHQMRVRRVLFMALRCYWCIRRCHVPMVHLWPLTGDLKHPYVLALFRGRFGLHLHIANVGCRKIEVDTNI